MRSFLLSLTTLAAAVLSPALAAAQVPAATARELMGAQLAASGVPPTSIFWSDEYGVWDPAASREWTGLTVTQALAHVPGGWSYLGAVINYTDQPYCVRALSRLSPRDYVSLDQTQGNFIVPPHSTLALLIGGGTGGGEVNHQLNVAFWPPNDSAGNGSRCSSVAPAGVVEWAQGTSPLFDGSRR